MFCNRVDTTIAAFVNVMLQRPEFRCASAPGTRIRAIHVALDIRMENPQTKLSRQTMAHLLFERPSGYTRVFFGSGQTYPQRITWEEVSYHDSC